MKHAWIGRIVPFVLLLVGTLSFGQTLPNISSRPAALPDFQVSKLNPFSFTVVVTPASYDFGGPVVAEIYNSSIKIVDSTDIDVSVDGSSFTVSLTQQQVASLPMISQCYISWGSPRIRRVVTALKPGLGGGSPTLSKVSVGIYEIPIVGDTYNTLQASLKADSASLVAVSAADTAVLKAATATSQASLAVTAKDTAVSARSATITARNTAIAAKDTAVSARGTVTTLRDQVNLLSQQVSADRLQTATNASQTAADRIQTGLDAFSAASSKTAAAISEANASNSATAASVNSNVYATEPEGRAAVADGKTFLVKGTGDAAAYLYRRTNSSSSVLETTYPSLQAAQSGVTALAKTVVLDSNVDDVYKSTTGTVPQNLSIPLTYTRNSSNGDPLSLGNLGQSKNANRSVTVTGWTDFTTISHITDMRTGVTSSGARKIIVDFTPSAFVTTGPMFGVGFVSGADRVIFLWRSTGQLAYTKAATSTFIEILAADATRDYFTGDQLRLELIPGGSSTTINLYIGGSLVSTATSSFLPTGDIILGLRGSMSLTYLLQQDYSGGQIETSLNTAKTYSDAKTLVVQQQIDAFSRNSVNLLTRDFVDGEYYSQGGGGILTGTGWKRTRNLIPVSPNTTYTVSGFNTEFLGNEYNSSTASSGTRVRVIAAGVGTSGTPFTTYSFTTSSTTTYLGLNIVSNPKTVDPNATQLQAGASSTTIEDPGAKYLMGEKIRGSIPGYSQSGSNTNYPKIFYSYDPTGYNDPQSGSTQGTGLFYVYVKYEPNSSYYARYAIARLLNSSIRADLWKITGADLYKWDGASMSSQGVNLLTTAETEFVWKEGPTNSTKTDFTGGYHGDELLSEVYFYADAIRLSSSQLSSAIALTSASDFWYIQKSDMLETDNVTNTVRCVHYKNTSFRNGGFTTKNRVVWSGTTNVYICYFGLATVTHPQATIAYSENYNYVTNTAPASPGVERINETGAHDLNYFNATTGLGAYVTSKITKAIAGSTDNTTAYDNGTLLVDWDVTQYAKYYRRLSSKTTSAGEVWEGEMTYKPYKK